jgi:hypothetical protein
MTGLELSRRFFFEEGLPLLQGAFPEIAGRAAGGLISGGLPSGCGSEVMGFDDEESRDHNWGPRFFLILSEEDNSAHGDDVRIYLNRNLPDVFLGYETVYTSMPHERAHVVTVREVIEGNLGTARVLTKVQDWLAVSEHKLYELTCGTVYHEPCPTITPALEPYRYYPDDVWLKRLGYIWPAFMQAGQAIKSAKRGDAVTTNLYLTWGASCVMRASYLFRRRYAPCNKWLYRGFSELPDLPHGLAHLIRDIFSKPDLSLVESRLMSLLKHVATLANDSGLLEAIPLDLGGTYPYGPFYHYTGEFTHSFERILPETVRGCPFEGPEDMRILFG